MQYVEVSATKIKTTKPKRKSLDFPITAVASTSNEDIKK